MKQVHLEIGNLVREYRVNANLTQMELAQKLGYDSPQFVSLFERGLSKIPFETLGQLVVFLGIPEKKIMKALVAAYQTQVSDKIDSGKRTAKGL